MATVSECSTLKQQGNAAYAAGDMDTALQLYTKAVDVWEETFTSSKPKPALEVGMRVRYTALGFGMVMSAFPMFDEYFLKDLGTDQAIWVGEPGGDLKRFPAKDLRPISDELFDLGIALAQNLAAVSLKRSDFNEVVRWADMALAMDGKAPKALMRLGVALLRLGKPGPASDRLAAAAKAMPNDSEVRELLREAEMKRSPTWVCASGCCGPWGIVCGGPIVSAMPEVVVPRFKPDLADEKDASTSVGEVDDQSLPDIREESNSGTGLLPSDEHEDVRQATSSTTSEVPYPTGMKSASNEARRSKSNLSACYWMISSVVLLVGISVALQPLETKF